MYKLFINLIILGSLNFLLADDIDSLFDNNQKKTTFNFINDAKSLNEDLKNNIEETSQKQRKLIGKIFKAKPLNYTIEGAESYCYYIKDEDSRYGCLSGIKLAKEDISGAESYCYYLKDEDSRYGCLSDVALTGYFIKQAENSDSNVNYEVNQLEEEIIQTKNELASDKTEALEIIRELEECEECLEDPEIKALYLQLKGDL